MIVYFVRPIAIKIVERDSRRPSIQTANKRIRRLSSLAWHPTIQEEAQMATDGANIDVGDEVPEMEWTPDADLVQRLVSLSDWDRRSGGEGPDANQMLSERNRFTDQDAARSEGFDNLIVPGPLGAMAMATAVQRWLPNAPAVWSPTVWKRTEPRSWRWMST
jgi:hypothetical protein